MTQIEDMWERADRDAEASAIKETLDGMSGKVCARCGGRFDGPPRCYCNSDGSATEADSSRV